MEIKLVVPADEGSRTLPRLRDEFGFAQRDEDWTVEKREHDRATMEYHPIPEPSDRREGW